MTQITLKQLACFAALEQTKSFRRAAERLNVSQPAFSAQIKGLEDALSLQLVERRTTGAALTPVGRDMLDHAQSILRAAQAMEDAASAAKKRLSGRVRLGVSATVGPYLLPEVVGALHARHPDLRLLIREATPAELSRELQDGAHDAILVQLPVREDGLVVEELYRERLMLILPADDALTAHETVPPEALNGLEVMTLDPRFHLYDQVAQLCEVYGATLSEEYTGSSLDALRLMVGMGAGAAFVPELYLRSGVRSSGNVVARQIRGRGLYRRIGLAWRRSIKDDEALRRLGEIAASTFRTLIEREEQ